MKGTRVCPTGDALGGSEDEDLEQTKGRREGIKYMDEAGRWTGGTTALARAFNDRQVAS
jgi:hypothetical protein